MYSKYPSFFESAKPGSLTIDNSYLGFEIPSAEELYYGLIWQDNYPLVSYLSYEAIIDFLLEQGCDISLLEEDEPITDSLSDGRTCYVFSFIETKNRSQTAFEQREKLINALYTLRYAAISKDELFLDSSETMPLHLSSREICAFAASDKTSLLPVAYRANYIYDRIVRELYANLLMRGDDETNALISDYLSLHSNEFASLDREEGEYLARCKLIQCIKNITCDRKTALAMDAVSHQAQSQEYFPRGVFGALPLSASAMLDEKIKKMEKLNKYSHHYCALIQYRYLLDLKSIFDHSSGLRAEIEIVGDEMLSWEGFRSQPYVAAAERLVERISALAKSAGKSLSLYWEIDTQSTGEKEDRLFIHVLPIKHRSTTLDRKSSLVILKLASENGINIERKNYYLKTNKLYAEGYHFYITRDELAKFSQQANSGKQIMPASKRKKDEPVTNEAEHIQLRKTTANINQLKPNKEEHPVQFNALEEQAERRRLELAEDESGLDLFCDIEVVRFS